MKREGRRGKAWFVVDELMEKSRYYGDGNTEIVLVDILDITLYFLSLQKDIKKIGDISPDELFPIFEKVWAGCSKKIFAQIAEEEDISEAAIVYFMGLEGDTLLVYLSGEKWAIKKEKIKADVFPKFLNKDLKKSYCLDFAQAFCLALRRASVSDDILGGKLFLSRRKKIVSRK